MTATTEFFATRYASFPDLDAYLNGYAITGDALASLTVPSNIIAAADDPVIPIADLGDLAVSPALSIQVFPRGGHCAFLEDYRLRSWVDRAVLAELQARREAVEAWRFSWKITGGAPLVTLISPSMMAPSATAIEWPDKLPMIRRSQDSTRCFATTSPSTTPATTMSVAFRVPLQCPRPPT